MKVFCGRCHAEGRPNLIGEREPLDDPREVPWPGICAEHKERFKAEFAHRYGRPFEAVLAEALRRFVFVLVLAAPLVNPKYRNQFGPEDQVEAARRLLRESQKGRRPALRRPTARRALAQEAEALGRDAASLLEELLPASALLAAADLEQAQRIRLGKVWIKDEDGKVARVRPGDLPIAEFVEWVIAEAYHRAGDDLAGTPAAGPDAMRRSQLLEAHQSRRKRRSQPSVTDGMRAIEADAMRRSQPLEREDRVPPDIILIVDEKQKETKDLFLALDRAATPTERKVLRAIEKGIESADIPNELGCASSTVRVHIHNLRKKARRIKKAKKL